MFSWESLHTHAVGGVSPHVTELAAGLRRLGHEVHVFVRATGSSARHAIHHGVHYHECCFNLNSDFVAEMQSMCDSFVWTMKEVETVMGQPFQICHAHDWLAARSLNPCRGQMGRTCLLTMHSTEFGRCGNNSYGGMSKRIRDVEGEACNVADRVICVSGVLADEVRSQYGVPQEKLSVIYNGIHCEQFDGFEDAGAVKGKYGIGVMEPTFLFVGRLVIQKGPDLMIEAIPHILQFRGDVKFIVVGDGHMRHELEGRANHLNVGNAVRFVGKKTGGELKSLFKACDAVLVPSRNEPFGIVVLEGWSAWKPVVATTCGGPRDFVSPYVDGVLVDPNASSIAWGCCEILKNFGHSQWMGSRGRVKAAYNFSWDTISRNTMDVYYDQLGKRDLAPCVQAKGDASMAFRLIEGSMYDHMTVFDEDERVARGLAIHKMMRLMTCGLAGEGYLNFMGNEFGHPEWIDMPRPSNGFSHYHARRRWDLADNQDLKFKHFELFDASMIQWESLTKWMVRSHQYIVLCNDDDKVVAFEKGQCLFVFNFHPHEVYESYRIGCHYGEPLKIAFDTDEGRFGGLDRLSKEHWEAVEVEEGCNNRPFSVKLDLYPRTAMVLVPESFMNRITSVGTLPPAISISADDFVSSLADFRKPSNKSTLC